MVNLLPIDRLIAATRHNLEHRVCLPQYAQVIERLRSVADKFGLPLYVKVVYSSARKVENVNVAGASWIIYDQYMGQSLNLLNRVFIEADDEEPGFIYFHKVLAERLVEVGRFGEALHCGIQYQQRRSALSPKHADEAWRRLLTYTHERFLLYHELGHRVFSDSDKLPAMREQVQSLIKKKAQANLRSQEELIEALRNGPSAAFHHQDLEDVIREIQEDHDSESSQNFKRAVGAALSDLQWQEEVFCDIFAADVISSEAILDKLDYTQSLRAIYIGFYHLQALEYLRRFPSLGTDESDLDWLTDSMPRVQARGHCLRAYLIFLRELELRYGARFKMDVPPEEMHSLDDASIDDELRRFSVQLMEDQKRHYDVIYDNAMRVCDNLRRNDWIVELGKEAKDALHKSLASKDEEVHSVLRNDELRTVVLAMTGWLP